MKIACRGIEQIAAKLAAGISLKMGLQKCSILKE